MHIICISYAHSGCAVGNAHDELRMYITIDLSLHLSILPIQFDQIQSNLISVCPHVDRYPRPISSSASTCNGHWIFSSTNETAAAFLAFFVVLRPKQYSQHRHQMSSPDTVTFKGFDLQSKRHLENVVEHSIVNRMAEKIGSRFKWLKSIVYRVYSFHGIPMPSI